MIGPNNSGMLPKKVADNVTGTETPAPLVASKKVSLDSAIDVENKIVQNEKKPIKKITLSERMITKLDRAQKDKLAYTNDTSPIDNTGNVQRLISLFSNENKVEKSNVNKPTQDVSNGEVINENVIENNEMEHENIDIEAEKAEKENVNTENNERDQENIDIEAEKAEKENINIENNERDRENIVPEAEKENVNTENNERDQENNVEDQQENVEFENVKKPEALDAKTTKYEKEEEETEKENLNSDNVFTNDQFKKFSARSSELTDNVLPLVDENNFDWEEGNNLNVDKQKEDAPLNEENSFITGIHVKEEVDKLDKVSAEGVLYEDKDKEKEKKKELEQIVVDRQASEDLLEQEVKADVEKRAETRSRLAEKKMKREGSVKEGGQSEYNFASTLAAWKLRDK